MDTYNLSVEVGIDGPAVHLIVESARLDGRSERKVVATVRGWDGIPYFHSFGLSRGYAVIVAQPLRLGLADVAKFIEMGFLRSMRHVDRTRVLVIDLESGAVSMDRWLDEKIYFYHTISQAELISDRGARGEGGGTVVSLRLCAYKEPDQLTGEHQFMRLERAIKGLDWRSKIHKGGKFCDVNCDLGSNSVSVEWNEEIRQGFELPVTRYSRAYHHGDGIAHRLDSAGGKSCSCSSSSATAAAAAEQPHPRYVYSFGAYALGSPDYDDWGLFKFDMEESKIAAHYHRDSVYVSEPAFVADPEGTAEDDGVLLTHAYFGEDQETKFLVFDAKTMEIIAAVPTGNRAPLDFHGAWIPSR